MPALTFRRALFVRLDRIGDLVLTLPTDQSAVAEHIDWWIPKGLAFITDSAEPKRSAREISQTLTWREILQLISQLTREVRKNRYDLAVIFHAPWWVSFVVWWAGVKVRVGVRSQWHSFLFFNRGVRQKRSRAECSELEYGFRLIEDGLDFERGRLKRSALRLHIKSGRPALAPQGEYYVVHPGMSGSALNWSTERYAALISALLAEAPVVITGTASDEAFLSPLKSVFTNSPSRPLWLDGKLSGTELIALLQNAKAVVAPSTGVLHLAASTGVPTIGIFSPVRVQRALRWGPQGPRTAFVEPPLTSEGDADCMNLITVDDVIKSLKHLLKN